MTVSSKLYAVYIMASYKGGTLYIGFTGDLENRVIEHQGGLMEGFTKRYGVKRLVHYEWFDDPNAGIAREKQLKHWNRAWKIALIERNNPEWNDLWPDLMGLRDL